MRNAMKKKRPACPSESSEQQALVFQLRLHGIGVFAVPNGAILGGRNKWGLLQKLKNEGMLAGTPDLVLMDRAPDGRPIAIEMKRQRGGVVSDDQRAVALMLVHAGWVVVVARGCDDGLEQLRKLGVERLQELSKGSIRTV